MEQMTETTFGKIVDKYMGIVEFRLVYDFDSGRRWV